MAKEYMHKALQIDIKQNDKNGMADDYRHIGTAELYEFRDKQTDSLIVMAKTHTLQAYALLDSTDDELALMLTCQNLMDIYFRYATSKKQPERQIFIDSSKYFYQQGFDLAKKNGYLDNSHDFKIMKAQYCIEEKDYDHAYRILKRADSDFQNDSTYIDFRIELYKVFAEYYNIVGQYQKAFDYQSKARKLIRTNFNRSYALKSDRSNVQKEFDRLLHDQEIKSEQLKITRNEQMFRQKVTNISSGTALIILIIFIIISYKSMRRRRRLGALLERHNKYIREQRDRLSDTNTQIKSSISYAQRIQYSMMPDKSEITALFGDSLVMWQPLNTVSGDFYWITKLGNKKIIAVVDCTGHGVPGALMSMLGMSTLSDIVNTMRLRPNEIKASDILELMRDRVIESLHQTEQNPMSIDGMDMALCILDEDTLTMQYAGAFRPLIVIRNGKSLKFNADKMPISYLTGKDKAFHNNLIEMQRGDTVYMFSDGITDQLGYNEDGTDAKFSTKRLIRLLEQVCPLTFDEQHHSIDEALQNWRSHANHKPFAQTDDIILVGFRI
jgi:serine phosphatase RsbU (regulator of sigma subunit)